MPAWFRRRDGAAASLPLRIPPATAFCIYDDRQVIVEDWHAELWIDDETGVDTCPRTGNTLRESTVYDADAGRLISAARRALHPPTEKADHYAEDAAHDLDHRLALRAPERDCAAVQRASQTLSAEASAAALSKGFSALSEGLPRDFPPRNAARPRKTGKGLRRRSEALSQAKPQVAADESGCTPGSVPRSLARASVTAIHLGPALPPASCGLPADSGGQPSDVRAERLLPRSF
ncbi:hypothetical protein GCM10010269_65330 [Streptomyces humidus]|uniref:Uncharacterized protein n=1 Tax=Streptomyces humidus TaxID=52259 RepID=A0A918G3Z3_9ACTN|nr:hypothetical protein GCM10010269_65330 [Streptomyces humidus]